MNITTITIKILTGLAVLFAVTKILGKTQISQITPFDFISSIAGDIFWDGKLYKQNFQSNILKNIT